MQEHQPKNKIRRPPVVAVLGHIDHGKSTLLDYIRHTSITEKEAGGITQHIAAYEAVVGEDKRKITFLDTPGHEAFCAIRERGSKIADIAILVVSAEDGVKPQTIEALKCIQADQTPFIVAINKIDKPNADIAKTKQDLAEQEVFVEGWGGTVPVVPISAKKGDNVEELLEMILLQADLLELESSEDSPASGFVIESQKDSRAGVSATLIIKDGVLKTGDFVASKGGFAPVRSIESFEGKRIAEARASSPIRIIGWSGAPVVGEEFKTFKSKTLAEEFVNTVPEKTKVFQSHPEHGQSFALVIKADAQGSLEAILNELGKIDIPNISVAVILGGIGTIGEGDIKMAISGKASVIGFNVSADKNASALAMRDGIEVKIFSIIYELTDWVKNKCAELAPKTQTEVITGKAKILKVFSQNRDKQVLGGKVEEGEIKTGMLAKIFRREAQIGEGRVRELQSQRQKTGLVTEGQEFGTMVESKIEIVPGDRLEIVGLS